MDNLRGRFSDYGSSGGFRDDDPGDDETDRELPPAAIGQDERRMQVRAYNFWASMLKERSFPAIGDIVPQDQVDFGPYSVMLDFTEGVDNPAIVYLGEKLADECGTNGTIERLSDVPSRSLLSRITDHYMQILANQAPIGFEAEFVNQRGSTILYRGILLPFSSDGATIDFIYGVINWKELADRQTADELLLQIDQALDPQSDERDNVPLTEWADGPADALGGLDPSIVNDPAPSAISFPQPSFGLAGAPGEAYEPEPPAVDVDLRGWLLSARELARVAKASEDRSRRALYAAIGRAYDFSIAAEEKPHDYRKLVLEAGLTIQDRAPMTPLVKLVFGADYDKTRLAEFAAALSHAHRRAMDRGSLAGYLASVPGGLKGVVAEERRLRREESGSPVPSRREPRDAVIRKLRALDGRSFETLSCKGGEFSLLIARRLPSGDVVLLGEVADDAPLLERAARHLLA